GDVDRWWCDLVWSNDALRQWRLAVVPLGGLSFRRDACGRVGRGSGGRATGSLQPRTGEGWGEDHTEHYAGKGQQLRHALRRPLYDGLACDLRCVASLEELQRVPRRLHRAGGRLPEQGPRGLDGIPDAGDLTAGRFLHRPVAHGIPSGRDVPASRSIGIAAAMIVADSSGPWERSWGLNIQCCTPPVAT